ncbi:transglutaminase TgpA family protein [Streptomyces camelliae]|uniref:TransglutaminaseTgpA domain-containing protein n=1 Tax=Streptomyces camelliae TaxID=3004093 RepID=A0ABY7P8J2_9ACTN|nr:transglutaminaseTgpA domain-containing protein [Streptomyces sp. HUAS 2-6]WBO66871.1 transglutaminaseTgpA domain-containing protein [Streptomyces sp. HUAS 2-6]
MSGRARLALCAAAATLMTSCALLPLVAEPTWLLQLIPLIAVQTGVGAAARRVPLGRPLTVIAQVLVTVVLLTLVFARQQAVLGLIPGPGAFRHLTDLLQQGSTDVSEYAIPAPLTEGIKLMLIGGVLGIGLLVDTLAVTFRSAAPAGLPLLALYSVAAGLSDGGADWLWFLVAAAGYLMLLLAEGRDRLAQWGRVFAAGPGSPGAPDGGAVAPVRTGRRIGAVALGVALLVPLALPAMSGGLLGVAGTGIGRGDGNGGTISAVNPLVSLRDSLNTNNDRQVLSLKTSSNDVSDLYLRIVSLDDFDGTTWKPTQRRIVGVPDTFPSPLGLSQDVRRDTVTTTISAADDYAQDWLPMPYPPSGVNIAGRWRYEPVGMTLVGDHGQTTRGETYQVTSLNVQPTAEQLASAPEPPADLKRAYTQVPSAVPKVVAQTARQITAGARNHYEEAVKLQDYFAVTGGFQYDTRVEVGRGPGAIATFLKKKQGFCVHFSFAMAAMARTLGIPARVAVGFAPGTPQGDGTVTVNQKDAHAWPELYFEGVGWTRFEPTPTRGTTPSYTVSDTPGTSLPDQELPSHQTSTAPSAAASPSQSCTAQPAEPAGCDTASAAAAPHSGGGGTGPWWAVLIGLAALVVPALPLSPLLWRARVRSVRLGAHARTEEGAAAHTLAAWQELTDSAWDHGIVPDESLTPRRAADRIVRLGELDPAAGAAVHRVADAVEQVLYAPRPRPAAGAAEDVRRVIEGLRGAVGTGARLRALFLPRSSVRVLWALSARWSALRSRVASARPSLRRPSEQQS